MSWGLCSSKAILGLKIALLPFPQKAEEIGTELGQFRAKAFSVGVFYRWKGKGREQSQCYIYLQSKQVLLKQVMWLIAPGG